MSEDELQMNEPEQAAAKDKTRRPAGRTPEGDENGQEVPLFLRDRSDGSKGNAQDEKDEVGE
jgi:hypothetical protein